MFNPELIRIILEGKKSEESDEQYVDRIRAVATQSIMSLDEISNSISQIGEGIDINIPVIVHDPIVTEDTINAMIKKHNIEIQKMKAVNRKIIEGIIVIITTGALAATGAGAAALLPIAAELILFLQNNYQQAGTQ